MRAKLFTTLALGAGLLAAAPVLANDDAVSMQVSATDLDLSNPADAQRLRARLARAATAVCIDPGMRGVQAARAFDTCRSEALSQAGLKADRAIAAVTVHGSGRVQTARR